MRTSRTQAAAPEIALAIVKGVSHVAPHAHVLKLKNEDFSRDPAVVAAMNADRSRAAGASCAPDRRRHFGRAALNF